MITDKIVKGAGSHRILLALIERPRTSAELKRLVGAINSISRFDGEHMDRLVANGYVIKDINVWMITVRGKQKCESLGGDEIVNRATSRTNDFKMTAPQAPLVRRNGSMDFAKFPSRVGPNLYYRDGRIEKVKD